MCTVSSSAIAQKMVFFVLFYVVYFNALLLTLVPQIYTSPVHLVYLLLFYGTAFIDGMVRPLPEKREVDTYTKTLIVFFGLQPFLFVLAFYENLSLITRFLPPYDSQLVSYAGISLYIIGAALSVGSRVQLGRQGSGRIEIREGHTLVTTGLYARVRHPMYSGGLVGIIAFGLVFRCVAVMLFAIALFFVVFQKRWKREEQLLEQEFGEQYREYMKRTRRLIPGVY
ncbi:MAG: isoprenylcysteine carboxylmethyltransferase family protein [Candidatus Thorarchaeota archaeon]|nr:isoprenylcysteine carboxylmethyltransferase family protein [Candidatus Thorarchaeota archaeon]